MLPKGTPLRVVMDLKLPVGRAFDLPGAELVFKRFIPPGLILKDVHSEGSRRAVVELEADPAWIPAVALFIARHWSGLILGAIGISLALSLLILSVRLEAPEKLLEVPKWLGILALIYLGWRIYEERRKKRT